MVQTSTAQNSTTQTPRVVVGVRDRVGDSALLRRAAASEAAAEGCAAAALTAVAAFTARLRAPAAA
ncbi:hypothetical protein DN069_03635 [Streptacidiphilus pinicola]|uniref:Uncharacterized protein n=1 Tax=Streptacidiphilus pinicola TaxID=2219663 RepID=A0A2X0IR08_9ACTN|nr:hypothetical protein [Streptacidiphilus pinicola]RAG87057.1 hypothetical protein DN069_03635 [Streptacidiphilus pinicola]